MTPTWRDLRLGAVLMLTAIGLWLAAYLPLVSTDKAVGIASSVIGAIFLGLIYSGAC